MALSNTATDFRVRIKGSPLLAAKDVELRKVLLFSGQVDTATFMIRHDESLYHLSTAGWQPEGVGGSSIGNSRLYGSICQVVTDAFFIGEIPFHYGIVVGSRIIRRPDGEFQAFESRFDPCLFSDVVKYRLTAAAMDYTSIQARHVTQAIRVANNAASTIDQLTAAMRNSVKLIGGDLIFNPVLDGIRWPNQYLADRVAVSIVPLTRYDDLNLFVDPRSLNREELLNILAPLSKQNETWIPNASGGTSLKKQFKSLAKFNVRYWTVVGAVTYLFSTCNWDQKHLDHPNIADLRKVIDEAIPNDYGQYLTNFVIPAGTNLIEALRMLLGPYGIDCYVDTSKKKPRLAMVAKYNPYKEPLQAHTLDPIDDSSDQAFEWDFRYDLIDNTVNVVEIVGDVPLAEVTMELMPAWPEDYDDTSIQKLVEGGEYDQAPDVRRRVWREWVANEAGDYDDLRDSPVRQDLQTAFEGGILARFRKYNQETLRRAIIPNWLLSLPTFKLVVAPCGVVKRRRTLLPTLTMNETTGMPVGQQAGTMVEFSTDAGLTWQPIESIDTVSVELLKDECGIRLSGRLPPHQLHSHGTDKVRMRVTATVEGDAPVRVIASANRTKLPHKRPLIIQDETAYGVHFRADRGKNASLFSDGDMLRARDDIASMAHRASQILIAHGRGSVDGTLRMMLTRKNRTFAGNALGHAITKLDGRGFSLKMTGILGWGDTDYPVVHGITLSEQQQTIEVDLTLVQRGETQ